MTFPYLDDEPIVPLEIQSKNGEFVEFHAYIDSGAAFSVFHSDHARVLGLKVNKGRKIFLTVGNGAKLPGFVHKLIVKFAGEKFSAEIVFAPGLGIGTNLLGLNSFFDKFSICFNHKRRYIEINRLK